MNKTLLWELCSRWLERGGRFQIRFVFISFTKLYVCLGLRVRIDGEMFELFIEDVDCYIRRLFDKTDVSIKNVYKKT